MYRVSVMTRTITAQQVIFVRKALKFIKNRWRNINVEIKTLLLDVEKKTSRKCCNRRRWKIDCAHWVHNNVAEFNPNIWILLKYQIICILCLSLSLMQYIYAFYPSLLCISMGQALRPWYFKCVHESSS